eukprot:6989859-Prymnesium_polylepis.1
MRRAGRFQSRSASGSSGRPKKPTATLTCSAPKMIAKPELASALPKIELNTPCRLVVSPDSGHRRPRRGAPMQPWYHSSSSTSAAKLRTVRIIPSASVLAMAARARAAWYFVVRTRLHCMRCPPAETPSLSRTRSHQPMQRPSASRAPLLISP